MSEAAVTSVAGAAAEATGLGARIAHEIAIKTMFSIHVFGLEIPISDTVVTTWILMILLISVAWFGTRRLKEVPTGLQLALESLIGTIESLVRGSMGNHGKAYVPFLGTVALYLGTANILPFITPIAAFGFEPPFALRPPTRDINVTTAFAVVIIMTVLISALRKKGPVGWAKSLVRPTPVMLPFNILEYFIRPLSLSLRLFGNILGAYIIMSLIEAVVPIGVPPFLGLYFDLFDGLIQAVVFTFLSTIFIAEAIE